MQASFGRAQRVLAQTRIMVVTDTHVMGPGLLVEDGEAWRDAIAYDRKMNEYSRAIFDELVETAIREQPQLLLMTGDLTKDGELLSHQYVAAQLERLLEAGIRTYVIPGNHDMGTEEAYYYIGDWVDDAETVSTEAFADIYRQFGYGDASEREPTTLTYCTEPIDGLVLIGIDTGHDGDPLNGVISEATLEWVAERAEAATAIGKQVLVMMHHSLFPHVSNVERLSSTYAVKYGKHDGNAWTYHSYSTVRNRLINAGVRVVLSGHIHVNDIARDYNSDRSRSVYDVTTATLAGYPCPYRMLTLSDDRQWLDITTRYITRLPGVEQFDVLARDRMYEGLNTLMSQYLDDQGLIQLGADIFLMHVEGNEPKSAMGDTYKQLFQDSMPALRSDPRLAAVLEAYSMDFADVEDIMYGMLEDKSHYGHATRENTTDDLTLRIDLKSPGAAGISTVARDDDDGYYYTLQGVRLRAPDRRGLYIRNGRLVLHQ